MITTPTLIRREGLENFQKLLQQAPLLSDFVFAHLTGQHDISTPEGKSLVMENSENSPSYCQNKVLSVTYLLNLSVKTRTR